MGFQIMGDGLGIADMTIHAHMQRFGSTEGQEQSWGPGFSPMELSTNCTGFNPSFIVRHHRPADDVTMSSQILGRAVHHQISAEG